MRRRFGRGRRGRGTGEGRVAPIDAERVLTRIVEEGIVSASELSPAGSESGADGFAVVGTGQGRDGTDLVVGFAPRNGGDAALAALAYALERGDRFDGEVIAVAPQWTAAARRRLAQLGRLPVRFRALAASSLGEGEAHVEAEPVETPLALGPRQAAAGLPPVEQALFARAAASFEGLAAKHGGSVRAVGRGFELVLLARRVAVLRAEDAGVVLETLLPDRSSAPLRSDDLSTAMDRFEGQLRKRLNDRRVRGSEEGLRSQVGGSLAEAADLRATLRWPLGGSDPEVIDLIGIRSDGRPVVAAVRTRLGVQTLSSILDATARIQPTLPWLLSGAEPPVRPEPPQLLLAAREWESDVLALLPVLSVGCESYDVVPRRGRDPVLEPRPAASAPPRPGAREEREEREPKPAPHPARGGDATEHSDESPTGGRRGGRSDAPRFEEISLFDLQEEARSQDSEEGAGRRRRRGRGRRRGRRGPGSATDSAEREAPAAPDEAEPDGEEISGNESSSAAEEAGARERRPRRRRERAPVEAPDEEEVLASADEIDLAQTLTPLDEDVPDLIEDVEPDYDEEDEGEGSPAPEVSEGREDGGKEDAGKEEAGKEEAAQETPEKPRPRRRAAIVAHADRGSILAAILLARDVRLIEGFWIYPQEELMTFFRSVATDLREDRPIWLVGFNASPAIDTLQAAALYQGRLGWFDHQDWPPEDLERLRQSIGAENVVVHGQAGSSLPGVLSVRTRRSRFSDKLVELATGRFSQHDYERWGRLWWHRLGQLAGQSGERRRDIDPLLAGRPSDLAREAAKVDTPPPPPEVEYVSRRDFRLVHFAGYTLCVVPTSDELDLHLCARIARERYGADVSLGYTEGRDLVVLAADETRGRRGLDLGKMVNHLAAKHSWIEPLPDTDFVARMRVRELASLPERLDEVIREIAMGRSALEA